MIVSSLDVVQLVLAYLLFFREHCLQGMELKFIFRRIGTRSRDNWRKVTSYFRVHYRLSCGKGRVGS